MILSKVLYQYQIVIVLGNFFVYFNNYTLPQLGNSPVI
jgi:hypothetical protein